MSQLPQDLPTEVQSHSANASFEEPVSRYSEVKREREIAVGPIGLLKNTANQLLTSQVIDGVYQGLQFKPDNEWEPDESFFLDLAEGLPISALQYMQGAVSAEHAYYLRERFQQRTLQGEQIAQWGGVGVAASFATEFFDPINLISGGVAGRLAGSLRGGAVAARTATGLRQTSRLARFAEGAGVSALVDGSVEALRAGIDPLTGPEDAAIGLAAGMAFGGTFNSMSRADIAPAAAAFRRASDRVSNTYLGQKLARLTEGTIDNKLVTPVLDTIRSRSAGHKARVDEIADSPSLPPRTVGRLAAVVNSFRPEFLSRFSLRFKDKAITVGDELHPRAAGVTEFAGDGPATITVRSDLKAEGRTLQTALHEMGEVLYRSLPDAKRGQVDDVIASSIHGRNLTTRVANAVYGDEIGRHPSKLAEPNEVFAELFARDAAHRGAGSSLATDDVVRSLKDVEDIIGKDAMDKLYDAFDDAYSAQPLREFSDTDENVFTEPTPRTDTAQPAEAVFDDFDPDDAQTRAAFSGIRQFPGTSMIGQLRSSTVASIRRAATLLHPDRVPNKDASAVQGQTVHELNTMQTTEFYGRLADTEADFQSWLKAKEVKRFDRTFRQDSQYREFGNLVAKAVRGTDPNPHPAVQAAADKLRGMFREMLDYGKEAGLFDAKIKHNDKYLSRVHDHLAYGKVQVEHGNNAPRDWWAGAMAEANPEWWNVNDPDDLKALDVIADRIVKTIMNKGVDQADYLRTVNDTRIERVIDELTEEGVDSGIIDHIRKKFTTSDDNGGLTYANYRAEINEGFVLSTDSGTVTLEDFIEPNAFEVAKHYVRDVVTAANDRKFRMSMRTADDIKAESIPNWDTIKSRMVREFQENNTHLDTVAFQRGQMDLLDSLYKLVNGRPIYKTDPGVSQLIRDLMGVNFVRVGGNFTPASIPEVTKVMMASGWKMMSAHLPEALSIFKGGKGSLEDAADFEYAWRGERLLNHPRYRVEITDPLEGVNFTGNGSQNRYLKAASQKWETASRGLQYAKYGIAEYSGLGGITRGTASLAGRFLLNKLARMDADDPSMTPARLAELGLSPEDAAAIARQLKAHSDYTETGLIRRINPDKWDDPSLYQKLQYAAFRKAAKAVQLDNPGDLPRWAQTPMGRMLIQFRRFPLVAMSNDVLRTAHLRDRTALAEFGASFVGAMATTVMLVHMKGIGREDQDEFMAENMRPSRLFKIALTRTPLASLLPGVIDTVASPVLGEPIFGEVTRFSGGGQDFITGNPTYQTVKGFTGLATNAVPAALRSDVQFTKNDAKTAAFLRAPLYSNFIDWLVRDMPTQSKTTEFSSFLDPGQPVE